MVAEASTREVAISAASTHPHISSHVSIPRSHHIPPTVLTPDPDQRRIRLAAEVTILIYQRPVPIRVRARTHRGQGHIRLALRAPAHRDRPHLLRYLAPIGPDTGDRWWPGMR